MQLSPVLQIIFRLGGLGLILWGAVGKLPAPWPIIAVLAGIVLFLVGRRGPG